MKVLPLGSHRTADLDLKDLLVIFCKSSQCFFWIPK